MEAQVVISQLYGGVHVIDVMILQDGFDTFEVWDILSRFVLIERLKWGSEYEYEKKRERCR